MRLESFRTSVLVFFGIWITFAPTLSAFASEGPTDELVVVGSRLENAPRPDDVVPRDAATQLDFIAGFQRLPGVFAFTNGGFGGASYLSLRGGEPNFTLTLIDGIRVNDPSNSAGGAFDFGQIDPIIFSSARIDRIGASAIHGPDALSGVVNLQTVSALDADAPAFVVGGTFQTDNAYATKFTARQTWSGGGITGTYARRDTGELTGDSTLQRDMFHIKVEQSSNVDAVSLTGIFSQTDREAFPEDGGGAPFAAINGLEQRETSLGVVGMNYRRRLADIIEMVTTVSYSRQDLFTDIPAVPAGVLNGVPARLDDSVFERVEVLSYLRFEPTDTLGFVAGAGFLDEEGRGEGELDFGVLVPTSFREQRQIASVFGEAGWNVLSKLKVKGALRWDKPTSFNGEVTGRASFSYELNHQFTLEGDYATGYKLPSIFALAFPLTANPDLLPETGESFGAGLTSTFENGAFISVRGFHNEYSNLIDFDPELFTNVNRESVETYGFEVFSRYPLADRITLTTSLGFLETDTSSDVPLRSRPKITALAQLAWQPIAPLAVQLTWDRAGNNFSSSVPTGLIELDGFNRIDAQITWTIDENWSLQFLASNLTDRSYEFAVGVEEPRANAALSIECRL